MKRLEEKINGADVQRIRAMIKAVYLKGFGLAAGHCTKDPGLTNADLSDIIKESAPYDLNSIAGEGILSNFNASEF